MCGEEGAVEWRVEAVQEVDMEDSQQIHLVDHAWTFQPGRQARHQLNTVPGLASRLAGLLDLPQTEEEGGQEELVEAVVSGVWAVCQTYSLGSATTVEERQPVW